MFSKNRSAVTNLQMEMISQFSWSRNSAVKELTMQAKNFCLLFAAKVVADLLMHALMQRQQWTHETMSQCLPDDSLYMTTSIPLKQVLRGKKLLLNR